MKDKENIIGYMIVTFFLVITIYFIMTYKISKIEHRAIRIEQMINEIVTRPAHVYHGTYALKIFQWE